uniref:AlNc14C276G10036 protein n=1 Tax=Albugo laibachii Nc14 TaxID=890382 RepID=F0WUM8_9STRA|nr:AlNc14C276G10036 [Albugo laibachii Nc14]|eukprot:CCA25109.1 AlNc14C276G10036 [Albugo laibachii Nc14]
MFDGKTGPWLRREVRREMKQKEQTEGKMTVNVEVLNIDVYRQFLIDGVIPAIKMKCQRGTHTIPSTFSKTTPNHTSSLTTNQLFQQGRATCGTSTPNTSLLSPDCNVLDLVNSTPSEAFSTRRNFAVPMM